MRRRCGSLVSAPRWALLGTRECLEALAWPAGKQWRFDQRGRYEELSVPKYTDTGGIFDIMAVTVIRTHLVTAA